MYFHQENDYASMYSTIPGAIMFTEMTIAMLEPTLPIWLIENVHPEKWQLGNCHVICDIVVVVVVVVVCLILLLFKITKFPSSNPINLVPG